jgi:hypothetical protein
MDGYYGTKDGVWDFRKVEDLFSVLTTTICSVGALSSGEN